MPKPLSHASPHTPLTSASRTRQESRRPRRRRSRSGLPHLGSWTRRLLAICRRLNPLLPLISPRKPGERSRRDLLTAKLRWATYALLGMMISSVVLASVPVRLDLAAWYLKGMANLAASSPLMIAAFSLGALAVFLAPDNRHNKRLAVGLTWLSRGALTVFAVLLPLQLVTAGWFVNQSVANDRARVLEERNKTTDLMAEVRSVSSKEEFARLLQRQSISVDPAALAATSLNEASSNLEQSLNLRATRLEAQLRALRRQGLARTVQDLAKVAVACLVMVLYLRLFVVWPLTLQPTQPAAAQPPDPRPEDDQPSPG